MALILMPEAGSAARPDALDWVGSTSLMWAARRGNVSLVRALILTGADINAKTTTMRRPHLAIHEGHADAREAAFGQGRRFQCQGQRRRTALMKAAARGDAELSGCSSTKESMPTPSHLLARRRLRTRHIEVFRRVSVTWYRRRGHLLLLSQSSERSPGNGTRSIMRRRQAAPGQRNRSQGTRRLPDVCCLTR